MNSTTTSVETAPQPSTAATATLSPCMGDTPKPTPAHEWLQQLVGDWDLEIEMMIGPNQPPMKTRGFDTSRMVGGFWLVSDGRNNDFPYSCRLTLGYDPQKQKYVGTWLDSMSTYLWHYVGAVDASGQVLTLETEGPFPTNPGKLSKFREVTEIKSRDHRVFTSSMLNDRGQWIPHLRINFRRRA